MPQRAGHGGKKDCDGYIPTHLSVCPPALLIGIANRILLRNCLLPSLKEIVRYDGHDRILGIRIVYFRDNNFCCYTMHMQAIYDHMQPPLRHQRKLYFVDFHGFLNRQHYQLLMLVFFFVKSYFLRGY
jgi:hypothetical protein